MADLTDRDIANMALDRIGAARILTDTDWTTPVSNEAEKAKAIYEQTRDALLRTHDWAFALAESELAEVT